MFPTLSIRFQINSFIVTFVYVVESANIQSGNSGLQVSNRLFLKNFMLLKNVGIWMKKHNNVVYLPLVYMLTHECDEEQAHYVNGIRHIM